MYTSYKSALLSINLERIDIRCANLSYSFAVKYAKTNLLKSITPPATLRPQSPTFEDFSTRKLELPPDAAFPAELFSVAFKCYKRTMS